MIFRDNKVAKIIRVLVVLIVVSIIGLVLQLRSRSGFPIMSYLKSDYFEYSHKDLVGLVRNKRGLSDNAIVMIDIIEENYVLGSGGEPDGGGFYWAAVKLHSEWENLMFGNGIPLCEDVNQFPVGVFGGKFDKCYRDGNLLYDRYEGKVLNP